MMRLVLAGGVSALALGVSACGSDDDTSSTPAGSATTASTGTPAKAPTEGKQGGVLTQLGASDVDYLDPGHSYYTGGYQVIYATNKTLYSFKPGEDVPVPDLADGEPEIAPDNKTITVKLQKNVKFAPPVNRVITSKDVKYAFERAFSKNVGGQYTFFFASIVGAPKKPTTGVKPISGITTPDDNTIVFKLSTASAPSVAPALVMPITAPVPQEYAEKFDAKNPSTYNTHVVASGPYMVKNDAQGNTTGYQAGKSINLVRNPNWNKATDYRPAYLDEIKITTNESNMSVAAQQILEGSHMAIDTNPPSAELKLAVTRYKEQYGQVASGGFRWFPLNQKIKPLDNINVRKAILAGFDRTAAIKARGGKFVGDPGTHFIPPGVPGFEEAGGAKGPGQDFLANPRGDAALAAEYMKKAGYPSGKYTGKEELLMITANADPGKAQALVAKAQLEKLGFKIRLRQVPQDAVYTEYCQVPKKEVAICGAAGWFKDFNDPQSMLEPTFKGSSYNPDGGNNNLGALQDPAIDAAMDKAALLTGDERFKAWAAIDKLIVDQAPAIPFIWDKTTIIWSKDVAGAVNGYYTLLDYSFTSLK
ncbi:ABC transporter substrate-binding protein [Paraconexibacter sp. AEG42_29]